MTWISSYQNSMQLFNCLSAACNEMADVMRLGCVILGKSFTNSILRSYQAFVSPTVVINTVQRHKSSLLIHPECWHWEDFLEGYSAASWWKSTVSFENAHSISLLFRIIAYVVNYYQLSIQCCNCRTLC